VLIIITWLTYGTHNYQGRIFIMALAHIGFFSFGALLAWQAEPERLRQPLPRHRLPARVAIAIWRLVTFRSWSTTPM